MRKEVLESILSFKFILVLAVTITLTLLSISMGLNEYWAQVRAHSNVVQLNRDQLERSTDWHQVGRAGIFVSRVPSSPAVFATGIFGIAGQVARIIDRDVPVIERGRLATNSAFMLFGSWDFHFMVKIILSLVALLFAYDAVSGEKEIGTLRLLLSNPLPRSRLILGKALGRYLPLLTAFTLAFILGVIFLFLQSDITFTVNDQLGILLIFLGSCVYLGVWFTVGLMASCLTNQSLVSLLLSLFLWMLLIFAIPKASISVASFLHPVPTPAELEAKKAALAKDMYIKLMLSQEEPLRRWMKRPPGDVPAEELYRRQVEFEKEAGRLRQLNEAEHAEKLYRLYEQYLSAQRALDRTASRLSRLSPSGCYDYFITGLAGTGPRDADFFLDQLIEYQKRFSSFISDMKLKQEIVYVVYVQEDPFKQTRPDLSKIPPFDYKTRPWRERWTLGIADLGLLCLYITVLFSVTYLSFLKYDPR
ncbi:MAG TPA: ABC transporter permease subunit [Blastocatellia bacterium]|nr:ABC transporter permease subunit [Blastocatellia bacterium]